MHAAPMRAIFLTHYFPPEVGAPQARMFELAGRLVAGGDSVTIVTGFPNYPTGVVHDGYRGRFAMEEDMDGVRVVRRWVYATPNAGFTGRIANHLSFAGSSLTAMRAAGPADVLWVESPPLFLGIAALAYSALKRAPYVLNVSDVWPRSAVELGALRHPAAIRAAEALESLLYRRAARITVPTPGILEDLAARGVPRQKLVHVTNGVDVDRYRPGPWPAGRKVFMYAGTHGLAQGLEVVLEAAKLIAKAERERIENVRFLPNQPRDAIPALLQQAFATVVTLKALDVFAHARPSKMYESMAAGRPIVASLRGEAAELVEAAGCGVVVAPEDPVALAAAIERLAADPEGARRMGERGRAYVVEHFSRATIAGRLREVL